jgi:glycosyltransferase involved in cell wall biosynthesis
MHLVSLQGPAGVELHCAEFLQNASLRYPQWTQGWLNPEKNVHPSLEDAISGALTHAVLAKHRWGIKLPVQPASIRSWHCAREFERTETDVLVIWNRTAKTGFVVDAMGEERCIHWEHGSAWFPGREAERRHYLRRIPLAIVNSHAAARVLELKWGFTGKIRVCLNALRPSLKPATPVQKEFPSNRAIRLGVAARLMPVKGIAVVLHSVAMLRRESIDVELHIAGAGVEQERLLTLAQDLGVESLTRFHGSVKDMAQFYRSIDCLLHPPLTEAFGLVSIEAAAFGCPAIVAGVDGLPEAVRDGVSGHCVTPTLSLAQYSELGGATDGLPEQVYDPATDTLSPPKAVDPAALVTAVHALFADTETYEGMSRSASEYVLSERQFDQHVDQVMDVIGQSQKL